MLQTFANKKLETSSTNMGEISSMKIKDQIPMLEHKVRELEEVQRQL